MNRVVVITGGSSGIGRAIAEAFALEDDDVIILGRREETLRAAALAIGRNCSWQRADVSKRNDVEAAVRAVVEGCGPIDVLINNAGYSRDVSTETTLAQAEGVWSEELGVNLTGAFLMALAVAPHLPRPGGRIVNISSDGAFTGGIGLRTVGYVTAKAGLLGLTRGLAREYGPHGVTVNAIAPGFVAGTGATGHLSADVVKSIAAQIPVGRAGHVDDVAAAALFLASPQAAFITGEVLNVNGGRVFG